MHAINKDRNTKGMLKLWRFQPNSFLSRVGKSFATQTLETMLYAKYLEQRDQSDLTPRAH